MPAALDRIVAKALAKDPDDRYETAAWLRDDLLTVLTDQPVAATTPARLGPSDGSAPSRPSGPGEPTARIVLGRTLPIQTARAQ